MRAARKCTVLLLVALLLGVELTIRRAQ